MASRLILLLAMLVLSGCASQTKAPASVETESSRDEATAELLAVGPRTTADDHCPFGCPVGASDKNMLIRRELYTLSYSAEKKVSDWVAYRIWPQSIRTGARANNYRAEPEVADPADALTDNDYDGVGAKGFARGHQAADKALAGADPDKTIDILSNLTPQRASLNGGVWSVLERRERDLLGGQVKEVFSVTGPILAKRKSDDPNAGLQTTKGYRVPIGYWKVIGVDASSGWKFGAFMIAQQFTSSDVCDESNKTSIDAIERATGLDLLPLMAAADQKRIEQIKGGDLIPRFGCP
jgi:endonuclease G